MEPFAAYAELFPGFPDRNHYVAEDATLIGSIRRGWPGLARSKYPLCYRPGKSLGWRGFDRACTALSYRIRKRLLMKPTRRRNRYQLLNLNQENVPTAGLPQKHATLRDEVVKELRLNFKVPLLHSTFPAMRVLVAIRHPGAQITSILRLFEGGRLAELRAALDEFVETIEEQERFAKYRDTLEAIRKGEASRLVLWWLVNYEVLLEDLAAVGAAHKVVTNEALSVDPAGVVSDVFNFCGITVDEAVTDYVRHSTSGKSETTSAVDTVRDSAPYSEKAIRATTPDLLEEIRAVFERQRDSHGLAPEIEAYLPALAIR